MQHSGRAAQAALKLILLALVAVGVLLLAGWVAKHVGDWILAIAWVLIGLWALFAIFTFYFFRDPDPGVPTGANLVVSPAHGKVDVLDTINEPDFMGGQCQRISVFLSVIDIHVQNAPVGGRILFYKYTSGKFMSALKTESAAHNENALIGFEAGEVQSPKSRGMKVGVRLIAGVLARRIVPFAKQGDIVARGDRISLIQFGSRTDIYLPMSAKIKVNMGDRVVGGETVIATFE